MSGRCGGRPDGVRVVASVIYPTNFPKAGEVWIVISKGWAVRDAPPLPAIGGVKRAWAEADGVLGGLRVSLRSEF